MCGHQKQKSAGCNQQKHSGQCEDRQPARLNEHAEQSRCDNHSQHLRPERKTSSQRLPMLHFSKELLSQRKESHKRTAADHRNHYSDPLLSKLGWRQAIWTS